MIVETGITNKSLDLFIDIKVLKLHTNTYNL